MTTIIDAHAHWFPQPWIDLLLTEGEANGATMGKNEKGHVTISLKGVALKSAFQTDMVDLAVMKKNMDGAKVDVRALSLTNPMVYWAPPAFGLKLSQTWNDASSALCQKYPGRFIGTIQLPMQAPDLAMKELERAAKLPGLRAVYFATHVNGKNLDAKEFWPVYERAEGLGLPVLLHPLYPCGGERIDKHFLRNLCGNPYENGIAAGSLMFGGVMDAFPKLEVMLPQGGGTFPWLIGRFQKGMNVRKELKHMPRPAEHYLRRFHYDTITHHPKILRFLIEMVGADRVMLGSDYNQDMQYERPVEFLDTVPGLTPQERALILEGNARRLLRL